MEIRITRVKVCGLTRFEDARIALEAGADMLGFVVTGESPRRIDPEAAGEIVAALPRRAHAVAVMVGPTPDEALRHARTVGAASVQLHRVDPLAWPHDFPLPVAISVPVDAAGRLTIALPATHVMIHLDAADPDRAGGTGRTFPWESVIQIGSAHQIMLAGGLGPDNVAAAIEAVVPFAVDASSRLESAPGLKDARLVRRFLRAARQAATRHV